MKPIITQPHRRLPAAAAAAAIVWLVSIPLCIAAIDRPAAHFAHDVIGHHPALRLLTLLPELMAPLGLVLLVVLGLAALAKPLSSGWRIAMQACLSMVVSDQFTVWLKVAFGRTWPETWVNHNPSFITDQAYGFTPFHGGAGWASFPSGHMTAICGFFGVLWWAAPKLRLLWATPMLITAAGLYAMDFHFVSDMLAGTGLGFAVAFVTVRLGARRGPAGR